MPALIPAIIGGVAAVGGALISSHAVNSASNAASQAAASNNALQGQIYDSNKSLIQPYVDRGNSAANTLDAFLGLGGDAAASKAALDQYLNSTGYTFQLDQGTAAITGNRAASGLLDSGGTLKALDTYGQGLAANSAGSWLDRLSALSSQGLSGVNALTGAGTNFANQVSANTNSAATAKANASLAGAGNINALIGQGLSVYGLARGRSSFGAGGGPGVNAITMTAGGAPLDV